MSLLDPLLAYYEQAIGLLANVTQEWVLYQLLALGLAAGLAYLLTSTVARRIEAYLDRSEGHWLRRWKGEILERIAPVIFLIGVWIALLVMRQITGPGNVLILDIAAQLATAWIVINILASVIRNRSVFRFVSVTLWIIAALSILDLLPAVIAYLDKMAFKIGDARLSALSAIEAVVLLGLLIWSVGFISGIVDRSLGRARDISPSMKVLLGKIARIVLIAISVVIAMTAVGIDLTAFAVFSGAVGVGVGFGLQKTVSNFFSGISLLLDKSIKPGDVISVGDTFGWISQLNTRYTSVVTRDGREHLIPNENLISQEVVNWSYTNDRVRIEVPFGVSYKADPHQVKALVEEVAGTHARVLKTPKPVVNFVQFGESSLDFVCRFWIHDPAEGIGNIRSDVLFAIWDVLKANNIEIPYPKRDLYAPEGIRVTLADRPPGD